jgi:two-component system, LytTR family, sensor kinase
MATSYRMAMRIRFNKYVEAAILLVCVFGFAGRYWVLSKLTLGQHITYFFLQFIILNFLWVAYYVINKILNARLPFEKGLAKRIATQLILGWLLIECITIPIGLYAFEHVIPQQYSQFDRLHMVFIGLTAFFGSSFINLGFIADHFFDQWRRNAVRAAHLEREKANVQFENLKNQLNPHFLFNSLASLDSLIMDNPALARQFLQQLSKFYRYILKSQDRGLVSVETEAESVKNYISLLSIRFADYLTIDMNLSPSVLDYQIVPMTLQILLENAIKHNAINAQQPLQITITGENAWLTVKNTVNAKARVEGSNRRGLADLSSLYEFMNNRPLEIKQATGWFQVRVPLM